ncbi:MAG: caspase family protein [Pseudomonadota bacterium]
MTAFSPALTAQDDAADLLVVNCLLPGQIRQLGTRTTYVSSRRPLRTTAQECRIRGGEYVVEDRASLSSALRVWLPAAQAGDAEAQTILGEMFEQGLGVGPDYAAARRWYTQAAAQNSARALTNLGNLYERGLGVARDQAIALSYYRQAMGLPEDATAISIDDAVDVAPVDSLVKEEINTLAAALDALRQDNAQLQASLAARDGQAKQLQTLQQSVSARDAEITRLSLLVEALQSQSLDAARLQAELADLHQVVSTQQTALQEKTAVIESRATESAAERNALAATVAEQQQQLMEKDQLAQARLSELQALMAEVAALKNSTIQRVVPLSPDTALAGPVINLIEPVLPATRGLVRVKIPAAIDAGTMNMVGRVTAPAGLLSLSVNRSVVVINDAGVFQHTLDVNDADEVRVTAIDKQGKRSDLAFTLTRQQADPPVTRQPDIRLGRFTALLIGNSRYRYLPQLETPASDIRALRDILTQQYGFDVQVLMDADRYAILSALNELRASLTPDDNLLIYYAGHGELDRANMRGHWLPVDAELDSTANWLSNVAITDILNVIRAKQIMLVVDSCYSGTLTRSSLTRIESARTNAERDTWLRMMEEKKSRVVMTSGGLAPVLDGGGGQHSVFAKAFLEALQTNNELLTGRALYEAVAARVAYAAQQYAFEQIPAYAPIARSGHEAGDFVLQPSAL